MTRRVLPFRAVRFSYCTPALFIICLSILLSLAGCITAPDDVGPPDESESAIAETSAGPAGAAEPAADQSAAEADGDADAAESEVPGEEGARPPEPITWEEIPVDRRWQPGTYGGTLRVALTERPLTLNPILESGGPALENVRPGDADLRSALQAGVVTRDALTGAIVPDLAESWSFSPDLRRIDVVLREGLRWSDGTPLTASDAVFTLSEIYLHEEVELLGIETPEGVRDAEVRETGRRTFSVTTSAPTYEIWDLLLRPVAPRHVFEPYLEEFIYLDLPALWALDTDLSSFVSCGPFVLSGGDWDTGFMLERNPSYHRTDEWGNRLPYLDGVEYRLVEGWDEVSVLLAAGELDMNVHQFPKAPLDGVREGARRVREYSDRPLYIYADSAPTGTGVLAFNLTPTGVVLPPMEEGGDPLELAGVPEPTHSWLNDRRFRRAVASLIDRDRLAAVHEEADLGPRPAGGLASTVPATRFQPPGYVYSISSGDVPVPMYDPDRAARMFDRMALIDRDGDGIREDESGNPVDLTVITNAPNEARVAVAEELAKEFRRAGLAITVKPLPWADVIGSIYMRADWHLMIIGFSGNEYNGPFAGRDIAHIDGEVYLAEPHLQVPRRIWEAEIRTLYDRISEDPRDDLSQVYSRAVWRIWYNELAVIPTLQPSPPATLTTRPIGNVVRGLREWPPLSFERLYFLAREQ